MIKVEGTNMYIEVPAELDHHNAEQVREKADKILQEQNIKTIIFDFAGTSFMDSSGIGVIVGRYKNISFMGGRVLALHVNERVRKILLLSGVHKIVQIVDDKEEEVKGGAR